jgi:hypothetical protein
MPLQPADMVVANLDLVCSFALFVCMCGEVASVKCKHLLNSNLVQLSTGKFFS